MRHPTIVFDLDGTLIDTRLDLLDSLAHCLGSVGLPAVDPVRFQGYLGLGGRVMIERAFQAAQRPLESAVHDRLVALFIEHYGANIPGRSQPFPGVIEAMDRLAAAGYRLAICTNKFERLSLGLIEGLGLTARFAANCGADTFAFRKPDPRHLVSTVERAGGDPSQAIMVGDSRTDIDTAKAAGIPVVAVDFGYTDQPVHLFEPSRVISHFDELTAELAADLIRQAGGQRA